MKESVKHQMKSAKIDCQKQRNAQNEFEKNSKTGIINIDGALF